MESSLSHWLYGLHGKYNRLFFLVFFIFLLTHILPFTYITLLPKAWSNLSTQVIVKVIFWSFRRYSWTRVSIFLQDVVTNTVSLFATRSKNNVCVNGQVSWSVPVSFDLFPCINDTFIGTIWVYFLYKKKCDEIWRCVCQIFYNWNLR